MTETIVDTPTARSPSTSRASGRAPTASRRCSRSRGGCPGFGSLRRFIALNLEGQEQFVWLQSLDDPSIALPTADPWEIFAGLRTATAALRDQLARDLRRPEDFVMLCVVVVSPGAAEMTMNLLAPVVVNLRTRVGRQVTLETGGYSVRTPIPARRASPAATAGA